MNQIFITNSSSQTQRLGKRLAEKILKDGPEEGGAIVLALIGELGSGKTTFLQGFARGLRIKEKILSPTFILMKKFQLPANNKQLTTKSYKSKVIKYKSKSYFYHLDCYRIEKPKELLCLGFKEIISNPQNIVSIEWADRIQKMLPVGVRTLKFQFIRGNERKISISLK